MICPNCNQNYDSLKYPFCPYCADISFNINSIPPPFESPDQSKKCDGDCKCKGIPKEIPNLVSISSQIPNSDIPRLDIMCPNCYTKNRRFNKFCLNCLEPLPTNNYQKESQNRIDNIIRCLDQQTRRTYFMVGLRLYLISFIGRSMKIDLFSPRRCEGHLPDGSPCTQILTVNDDDCPVCKTPYLRYECPNCHNQLTTHDLKCQCGETTYLGILDDILNLARGNGVDNILADLESTFQVKLYKSTFSSIINPKIILQSKLIMDQLAGDVAELCKTLAKYLRDSMEQTKNFGMGDAFKEIREDWGNQGINIVDVTSPIADDSIIKFLKDRSDEKDDNNGSLSEPDENDGNGIDDNGDPDLFGSDDGDPTSNINI